MVSAVSSYANVLGGMFGHVEIEMNPGPPVTLADNSTVMMCEFGLIVTQPGAEPNQFIPWGSVRRIIEAPAPQAPPGQAGDGQLHD